MSLNTLETAPLGDVASKPEGLGHALERAAYALGCGATVADELAADVWNGREAVCEARLQGEPLPLARLLAEQAMPESRDALASRAHGARRWLKALWLVREAPAGAPLLSAAHWQAVLSSLVDHPEAVVSMSAIVRWSEALREDWEARGALAAACAVSAPDCEPSRGALALQLSRLASHALLHHGGLAAGAVTPLAEVAGFLSASDCLEFPRAEPSLGAGGRSCVPHSHATAWLEALGRGLRARRRLLHTLRHQGEGDAAKVADLPRCATSTLAILAQLRRTPVATITGISQETKICFPTTLRAIQRLIDCGIVREITGRRSKRVFAYEAYVQLLEPIAVEPAFRFDIGAGHAGLRTEA